MTQFGLPISTVAPRWATLNRAVKMAVAGRRLLGRTVREVTDHAKELLTSPARSGAVGPFVHRPSTCSCMLRQRRVFLSANSGATWRAAERGQVGDRGSDRRQENRLRSTHPTARVKKVIEISFHLSGGAGRRSRGHPPRASRTGGGGRWDRGPCAEGPRCDQGPHPSEWVSSPNPRAEPQPTSARL